METKIINSIGLILNIIGVVVLFRFGFPQPSHEEGSPIGLEANTPLKNGRTVSRQDEITRQIKNRYRCISGLALGLILAGFLFQMWAAWK